MELIVHPAPDNTWDCGIHRSASTGYYHASAILGPKGVSKAGYHSGLIPDYRFDRFARRSSSQVLCCTTRYGGTSIISIVIRPRSSLSATTFTTASRESYFNRKGATTPSGPANCLLSAETSTSRHLDLSLTIPLRHDLGNPFSDMPHGGVA
jgi:hypothetical protein